MRELRAYPAVIHGKWDATELVVCPRFIPPADWSRAAGIAGAPATNKARRQTIPAFRVRDRRRIAEDFT
ncbi:hypothetical protein GCM10009651_27390 [Microbacterium natoriense]